MDAVRDSLLALRARLDRVGVILSGLCLVHCLAGLFLIGVLGLGGGALLAPSIHRVGLGLAVVVGALTIGIGAIRHGRMLPLALGGTGVALMAAAVIAGHGSAEAVLTICGVVLVASAHIVNIRKGAC
ncbi:MerC domain-containing protein [Novosphingobium cyanobacteriorum]|uniref:MerC domain-containing protein n=1 Tax=Novosphingobium cyanobacteriorum TaxID=3024215 RepID=UPI0024472FEE|nr:MerC domain-containing protein [Novosphingobium cyanobacteriorum]